MLKRKKREKKEQRGARRPLKVSHGTAAMLDRDGKGTGGRREGHGGQATTELKKSVTHSS